MIKKYPFYHQLDSMDCGAACLQMISKYYGRYIDLQEIKEKCLLSKNGVSITNLIVAAENLGFRPTGIQTDFNKLAENSPFPCILHWNSDHFVVCYSIKKKLFTRKEQDNYEILIADPAQGLLKYSKKEFIKKWTNSDDSQNPLGYSLLLYPTPDFFTDKSDEIKKKDIAYFAKYIKLYKKQIFQIFVSLGLGFIIQLLIPFLTQAVVDTGIRNSNLNFILLVSLAQVILYISQIGVEFIRSWILLHMNTRITISLISDFLIKLMRLPIGYFDSKKIGDILQRIGDHDRILNFLTGSSISTLFSLINIVVFSFVLAYYSFSILFIYFIGNSLYILWVLLFLKRRRQLDYLKFEKQANEQGKLIQLVTGMQEIKLNNCERQKRWQWEDLQVGLYRISIKSLTLEQLQQTGTLFFSQITSIIISFVAAKSVIEGNMTLGMMMSLTYIIGQLNAPISQFISFVQSFQDAKISLERLGEIHNKTDEDEQHANQIMFLPNIPRISMRNVSFRYSGSYSNNVIDNISFDIPEKKITAIVGASGSGKTTIMKLLLGFYPPNEGQILLGNIPLNKVNPHLWREKIGAVLQDGYIFSDTIANNIALDETSVDFDRLIEAAKAANIFDFINSLPLGFNTQIGMEGNGISQGQKQRILIARVIYKNPDFIIFDEATNALDSKNENIIMYNLNKFYKNKTVVVIAHRLSTIKNAHNIIVMNEGRIVEQGNHEMLMSLKGYYNSLVCSQAQIQKID